MKQAGLDLNLTEGEGTGVEVKEGKGAQGRHAHKDACWWPLQEAPGGEKACRVVLPHLISLQVQALQLLPCPQLASFFCLSSLEVKAALPIKLVNPGL